MIVHRPVPTHLPFNGDSVGGTLCLAGLAEEAVLPVDRHGRPFSSLPLFHLVDHKRTHGRTGPAPGAAVAVDRDFLGGHLFPCFGVDQIPSPSPWIVVSALRTDGRVAIRVSAAAPLSGPAPRVFRGPAPPLGLRQRNFRGDDRFRTNLHRPLVTAHNDVLQPIPVIDLRIVDPLVRPAALLPGEGRGGHSARA